MLVSLVFVGNLFSSKTCASTLYFSVTITEFILHQGRQDPTRIYGTLTLASQNIDVMTDRPLREESQTTPQNFVTYVTTRQKPLVYSLSFSSGATMQTLNFNVERLWIENNALHMVGNLGPHKTNVPSSGQDAVLNVEG